MSDQVSILPLKRIEIAVLIFSGGIKFIVPFSPPWLFRATAIVFRIRMPSFGGIRFLILFYLSTSDKCYCNILSFVFLFQIPLFNNIGVSAPL